MTKENMMRFRRIYNILLSIVIVIAGICLIAACLGIYQSGDQPFSRESVAAAFSGIAFPVYLCLAMTILSFVIEFFLPSEKEKTPVFKPYAHLLSRLQAKRDLQSCDETFQNEIASLQKGRRRNEFIRNVIIIVCSIAYLYAANDDRFHTSQINNSMIQAMTIIIPALFVAFAAALAVSILNEKSMAKEIELMKQAPTKTDSDAPVQANTNTAKNMNISRSVIIGVAVFCIVYEFISGGTIDVLAKAINICTECIGLG